MSTTYEYRVVFAYSPEDLSRLVSSELLAGWELYGNLCVTARQLDTTVIFTQSLVKKVERRGPYD
jgi:hypothetical protein